MTKAKITYNDGQVRLECDGNPLIIMIHYEGIIQATSNLPQGFIVSEIKKNCDIKVVWQAVSRSIVWVWG